MLTKPDVKDELIISHVQEKSDLRVADLTFLPIGANMGSAIYRIVTENVKESNSFSSVVAGLAIKANGQSISTSYDV